MPWYSIRAERRSTKPTTAASGLRRSPTPPKSTGQTSTQVWLPPKYTRSPSTRRKQHFVAVPSPAPKTIARSGSLASSAGRRRGVCGDGFDTAIDPNNAGTVYASSNGGLFRSTNGGGSWVQLGGGLPSLFGASIYIDGSTPNVLYASPSSPDSHSDLGLYQSLDGGDTWRQVFAGTGSQEVQIIDQVVISPSNSNIVYLVIGEYDTYPFSFQLWTTNNALANSVPTWQNVSTTTADNAYLAADPTNPEAIAMFVEGAEGSCGYGCGLSKNSVQTSSDGGATWQSIPVGGGLSQITVNGNSLFGSPLLGGDNLQLLIDPDIPGIWYLAAGVTVYRSSDSGQTWYPLATGLPLVEPGRLQMQRPSRPPPDAAA